MKCKQPVIEHLLLFAFEVAGGAWNDEAAHIVEAGHYLVYELEWTIFY
jgi:hypothetical protein